MKKLFNDKFIVNTAIAIVLVSFIFMESGCAYYKVVSKHDLPPENIITELLNDLFPESAYPRDFYPEGNLRQIIFSGRDVYAFDAKGRWLLNTPVLKGDSIFTNATISPLPPANDPAYPENRKSRQYNRKAEERIVRRINLYVDTLGFISGDSSIIPVSAINSYDVYESDGGKSGGVALAIALPIGLTVLMISLLISASVRAGKEAKENASNSSSCPFIYAFDGEAWQFMGEIYGGATLSTLEREDYLALPSYHFTPGMTYTIRMANMLQEIQYINQADLLIIEHSSEVRPLVDKYGQVQTIQEPLLPSKAVDSKGNDCLSAVTANDRFTHNFDEDLDTAAGNFLNSLELTFTSNSAPGQGKLILNAGNSLWGDYMVNELHGLFGKRYDNWVNKKEQEPPGDYLEWMQQQGIPLLVYALEGEEWNKIDYFNLTGAFGFRDMVLPMDLSHAWTEDNSGGQPGYSLKLKLVTGFQFWQVNSAAIDLTENVTVGITWVDAGSATDQHGKDVAGLISSDDGQYLVQEKTGDYATLEFNLPTGIDPSFTLFLHSKGYYHQAEEGKGKPDVALLKTFLEPGKLSRWSYDEFSKALAAYNASKNN
jgi:hypothetical protein